MKVVLNDGTTVDCSVEEFLELKRAGVVSSEEAVKPVEDVSEPVKKVFIPLLKGRKWSRAEVRLLRENLDKHYSVLQKLFPDRSLSSIYKTIRKHHWKGKRQRMKVLKKPVFRSDGWSAEDDKIIIEHYGKTPAQIRKLLSVKRSRQAIYHRIHRLVEAGKISKLPVRHNTRQDRLKFLHSRAKYYVGLYKWSYEKALAQASQDWRTAGKQAVGTVAPKPKETFFTVYYVDKEGKEVVVKYFGKKDVAESYIESIKNTEQYKDTELLIKETELAF